MGDSRMKKLMDALRSGPTSVACSEAGLKPFLDTAAAGLESPLRFEKGAFPMLEHRRRIDGRDFFWLANNADEWQACEVALRSVRGGASIWDCETGDIRPVASSETESGSKLALVFKPYEAYWLVFDPEAKALSGPPLRRPEVETVAEIEGLWKIFYDPKIQPVMEYPLTPPARFEKGMEKSLEDWKAWGLEKFSGLMDYVRTVTLDEPGESLELDLGKVAHAAEVWVNGKNCGRRLWGPYVFDVGDALRRGSNEIRVRVANLVNNSYGEPAESGLFGPVRLIRFR
jgi:hypothetical protein